MPFNSPGSSGGREDPNGSNGSNTGDYYDPATGTYKNANQGGGQGGAPGGGWPAPKAFDPNTQLGVGQYYNEKTGFDPGDYMYGGQPGMEKSELGRATGQSDKYDARGAPITDYTQANESRGQQGDALGLMRGAAMGQAPSFAAIQQQQGLNQAMGMNMGMAASARGGSGAQALAQRSMLANNADMQQGATASAAGLRAQEMAQARGEYMGGASNMRGMDTHTAEYQSDLAMKNRLANDAMVNAAEGRRSNVITEGDTGRRYKQQILSGDHSSTQGLGSAQGASDAKARVDEQGRSLDAWGRVIQSGAGAADAVYKGSQDGAPMGSVDSRQSPNDKFGPGY